MAPINVELTISIGPAVTPPASIAELPKQQEVTIKAVVGRTTVNISIGTDVKFVFRVCEDEARPVAPAMADDIAIAHRDDAICVQSDHDSNGLPEDISESLDRHANSELEHAQIVGDDVGSAARFLADTPRDMLALKGMTAYAAQYGRARNWNGIQSDVVGVGAWGPTSIDDADEATEEELYAMSPTLVAQEDD